MSVYRLALGLAAATAAAVMYSQSRKPSGGESADASSPGMGSTPGTDRWTTGAESSLSGGSVAASQRGSALSGLDRDGAATGASMTGTDDDDLLSPSIANEGMAGSVASTGTGRSGGI